MHAFEMSRSRKYLENAEIEFCLKQLVLQIENVTFYVTQSSFACQNQRIQAVSSRYQQNPNIYK